VHIAEESTEATYRYGDSGCCQLRRADGTRRRRGGIDSVMPSKNIKRTSRSTIRTVLVIVSLACCVQSPAPRAFAATVGEINLGSIAVTPVRLSPGEYPNIEARVSLAKGGTGASVVVNVIAVMTQPDNRVRSWNWKKVKISQDAAKTITIPKEYDTSAVGTYRFEIMVYSNDMKRRLARRSRTFDVVERSKKEKPGKMEPYEAKKGAAIDTPGQERTRTYMGLGIYGNALNPAGGGMVLLWPSKYVGIEGIYTAGEFTSYEGRLIVKIDRSQKYGFYGGIGYIHVTTVKDIIGVPTRFSDSGMSGVVGVEVALGKKVLLHVEANTAQIELKQIVTSGAETVKASVKYAPVSIGVGLVLMVF